MDILLVLLTAIGLAMDCLAVSLSCGIAIKDFSQRDALRLGLFFGGFQSMMTFIGWAGGTAFAGFIGSFDHWVAFVLLLSIGIKMVSDGLEDKRGCESLDIRKMRILLILSLATSIDAMAVGISYAVLDISISTPAAIIGLVSLIFAYAGGTFGGKLGERFGKRMEILGGAILILLGIKILAEHIF